MVCGCHLGRADIKDSTYPLAVADTMLSRGRACPVAASASAAMLLWTVCTALPDRQKLTIGVQDFAAAWANLVMGVLAAAPEAEGRLLFDIMNEPDGRAPDGNSYMHSQHATRQRVLQSPLGAPDPLGHELHVSEALSRCTRRLLVAGSARGPHPSRDPASSLAQVRSAVGACE